MRGGQAVSGEDLEVGALLAAARRGAGMSQAAAARELGFAQSRIAKLEIGTRRLLFSEAVALAGLYGVALDAFVPSRTGIGTDAAAASPPPGTVPPAPASPRSPRTPRAR